VTVSTPTFAGTQPETGSVFDEVFGALRRLVDVNREGVSAATGTITDRKPLVASTGLPVSYRVLYLADAQDALLRVFRLSEPESFEPGMENEISNHMESLVQRYGDRLIQALQFLYLTRSADISILGEALVWLGRSQDSSTRDARFWFLVWCLYRSEPSVRSSAALGLEALNDTRAAFYLNQRARVEPFKLLRARLERAASELTS
jgi:hypothetical protein